MITYNHEKYIAQAIESVMEQKTNFDFTLFIGEDGSTDKTRDICINYKNRFQDKIELILHERNIGPAANAIAVLNKCSLFGAKYIAFLEGDDYWIDPLKLQKQYDLLSNNPNYSFCFHNASILGLNEKTERLYYINLAEGVYTYKDFLANDSFPHISTILLKNIPEIIDPITSSHISPRDIFLILLALQQGDSYYLNEVMSCRRLHDAGIWSSLNKFNKLVVQIDIRKEYLVYFKKSKLQKPLSRNLINKLFKINDLLIRERRFFKFLLNSCSLLYYAIRYSQLKHAIKMTIKGHFNN